MLLTREVVCVLLTCRLPLFKREFQVAHELLTREVAHELLTHEVARVLLTYCPEL